MTMVETSRAPQPNKCFQHSGGHLYCRRPLITAAHEGKPHGLDSPNRVSSRLMVRDSGNAARCLFTQESGRKTPCFMNGVTLPFRRGG